MLEEPSLSLVTDFRVQGLSHFGAQRWLRKENLFLYPQPSSSCSPLADIPPPCAPQDSHTSCSKNSLLPRKTIPNRLLQRQLLNEVRRQRCAGHGLIAAYTGPAFKTLHKSWDSLRILPSFLLTFPLLTSQLGAEQLQTPPGCVPTLLQPLECRICLCTEFEANIQLLHANPNASKWSLFSRRELGTGTAWQGMESRNFTAKSPHFSLLIIYSSLGRAQGFRARA